MQLTRSLATAWAADNIQVNAVLPGWIDTDLTRKAREQVPGLNERVLARTPAGRWGVPADLVLDFLKPWGQITIQDSSDAAEDDRQRNRALTPTD